MDTSPDVGIPILHSHMLHLILNTTTFFFRCISYSLLVTSRFTWPKYTQILNQSHLNLTSEAPGARLSSRVYFHTPIHPIQTSPTPTPGSTKFKSSGPPYRSAQKITQNKIDQPIGCDEPFLFRGFLPQVLTL